MYAHSLVVCAFSSLLYCLCIVCSPCNNWLSVISKAPGEDKVSLAWSWHRITRYTVVRSCSPILPIGREPYMDEMNGQMKFPRDRNKCFTHLRSFPRYRLVTISSLSPQEKLGIPNDGATENWNKVYSQSIGVHIYVCIEAVREIWPLSKLSNPTLAAVRPNQLWQAPD